MERKIQPRTAVHHESPDPLTHMKIGLILECQRGGPDQQVYEHLVKEVCPKAEVTSYPQTNKLILMEQAVTTCIKALEKDKCDFVLIIWDLSPAHPDKTARLCMKSEKDLLLEELSNKGVDNNKVKLVCVEYELESILIADGRGLTSLARRKAAPHPVEDFPDHKRKHQRNPKNIIWGYYRQYNDFVDAIKVFRYFGGNYRRLRRNNASFDRIMVTLETLAKQHGYE